MDIKMVGDDTFYLHRDHLSSVRMVTDAAGAMVEATGYGPYGDRKNNGMQTQKGYIPSRHLLRKFDVASLVLPAGQRANAMTLKPA